MKKCLLLLIVIMNKYMAFSQTATTRVASHMQTIHLIFQNTISDSLLQTGVTYTNAFGEPFTIRTLKYYISNIEMEYANQDIKVEGQPIYKKIKLAPHLVNEADSTSKQLSFGAPAGVIVGMQFTVGVDSITNTTGVQTGDLDPAKGMYWIWNTGYIMAKLEGFSPAAKTPAHQFTYDIGGYKNGEQAARIIKISVPSTTMHQLSTFFICANVLKWFAGVDDIKISEQPMCHEPGKLAMQIADNYQQMFSVKLDDDKTGK